MDAIKRAELLLLQHQTNQTARKFLLAGRIILHKLLRNAPLSDVEREIAAGIISCQLGNWIVEDIEIENEKEESQ